jgi:hypothetical protein
MKCRNISQTKEIYEERCQGPLPGDAIRCDISTAIIILHAIRMSIVLYEWLMSDPNADGTRYSTGLPSLPLSVDAIRRDASARIATLHVIRTAIASREWLMSDPNADGTDMVQVYPARS